MKVTSFILFVCLGILLSISCKEIEREVYSNTLGRYVRFNLLVDANGKILDNTRLNPDELPAVSFDKKTIQSLSIPVTLTSEPLEEDVFIEFSYEVTGNYSQFSVAPDNRLHFYGKHLTDTITVNFFEKWEASDSASILFKLIGSSNPEVKIGNLNSFEKNDELRINLSGLTLRYNLLSESTMEISGKSGESISFDLFFPDGLFASDIDDSILMRQESAGFKYSLTQFPADTINKMVSFVLTVDEELDNEQLSFETVLSIINIPGYYLTGNTNLTIIKPVFVQRENSVNTAAHFYKVSDPLNRVFGVNWMDLAADGQCEWRSFSTFTYPVVVSADHPNAVLFDDKGTADVKDDVYHHAFRIGFNSPNIGNTTNSFNLKRWFSNYSTNSDVSPGFNIVQALEFFPENGSSTIGGTVQVIKQDIVLGATGGGAVHTISIEGEGVYAEISTGVFEITLELRATNEELFGGTRVSNYKIYNIEDFETPLLLSEDCFVPGLL